MGDPHSIRLPKGLLIFNGEDVTELAADKLLPCGHLPSYQAPVEVPGVHSFLYITQMRPGAKMTAWSSVKGVGQDFWIT